jgi:hypothetical protein
MMTTIQKHELRGKLGIGSTLGHSLSILRTSEHCNLTPPFAYYKRGGRDPQLEGRTARQHHAMAIFQTHTHTRTHTHTHSSTRIHPHAETWEPSLSQLACIPLLQALRCKATRAAASTGRRDIQPELVYILCLSCTLSEAPTCIFIHLSPYLDTPHSRTPTTEYCTITQGGMSSNTLAH